KVRYGLPDGGVSGVGQSQADGFLPAGLGGVHTGDADLLVQAPGQARAALAHAAQTDDEKFHDRVLSPRQGRGQSCGKKRSSRLLMSSGRSSLALWAAPGMM